MQLAHPQLVVVVVVSCLSIIIGNTPEAARLRDATYRRSDTNFPKFKTWFCDTKRKNFSSNVKAMHELKAEACDGVDLQSDLDFDRVLLHQCIKFIMAQNYKHSMCHAFDSVDYMYRRKGMEIKGLSKAESFAVTMTTTQFSFTYNRDLLRGRVQRYPVYSALLFNALMKLGKLGNGVPNRKLYRGTEVKFDDPGRESFFFKQFISTSLSKEFAEKYGSKFTLIFAVRDRSKVIGAHIRNLSIWPDTDEVLLAPFNSFQVVNYTTDGMVLRESDDQYFQGINC